MYMTVFRTLWRLLCISAMSFFCSMTVLGDENGQRPGRLELVWHENAKKVDGLEQLAHFLRGATIVTHVSFKGDIILDTHELGYLTDCEQGKSIDPVGIAKAFAALVCTQRFARIQLVLAREADGGLNAAWHFAGLWRFDRLKVHGLLVGKDWYAQLYQVEAGMPFTTVLHDRCLARMVSALHDRGYFDANVASRLDRNEGRKLVVATIWPRKGVHYKVGTVQCLMEPQEQVSDEALSEIKTFANDFLKKRLEAHPYSHQMLNDVATDLKHELTMKGFLQTRIKLHESIRRSAKAVDVTMTVLTGQCKRIVFFGNRFFATNLLFDRLLLFGQSVLLLPGSVLADELLSLYKDKGFFEAKVEVVEEREALFFIITEGARSLALPLELSGVSEENRQKVTRITAPVVAAQWYDEAVISRVVDALSGWYLSNGYIDCRVRAKEPELTKEGVRVAVVIAEGERRVLDLVAVNCEETSLVASFEQRMRQDIGKPLSPTLIDEQRRYLQAELRNQGYLQARVALERTKGDLVWRIENATTQTHVGKIILSGTTRTPFKHLQRLIRRRQGLVWRQDVFKDLFSELKRTDAFSTIHIDPVGSTKTSERPVSLALHDDDPFELRLRAGAALEAAHQNPLPHAKKWFSVGGVTYRVGGTLAVKNPFNRADTVHIDADVSATQRTFELGYSQPWLIGSPVRFEGLAYSHHYDQPSYIGSKKNLYKMFQHGALTSFHRKEGIWDAGISFGFEWDKTALPDHSSETLSYVASVGRALRFDPAMIGAGIPYLFAEPTAIISTLDSSLQPTKGSFTVLTLKGMAPIGGTRLAEPFIRMSAEQSFFVPIQKVVAAFRLRFGHIFNKQFDRIMPSERFFLGGANSVRGYATDFAPPLGCYIDDSCKKQVSLEDESLKREGRHSMQLVPQGGRSMVNLNLELRFPIVGSLGGVLFQDAGALHDSSVASVRAKDMVAASGFGLRYQTPVGPLRFDAGWRWKDHSFPQRKFIWFLGFGSAF